MHTPAARGRSSPGLPPPRALAGVAAQAGGVRGAWWAAVTAAVELALPLRCGGCDRPGSPWCACCRAEVEAGGPSRAVRPVPEPDGFPPTWAATSYEGPLRRALTAYKDEGRRDLLDALADLLATPLRRAVACAGEGALIVPVPSSAASARRRGDRPLEALTRAAWTRAAGGGGAAAGALRPDLMAVTRAVRDQAGLDHVARVANVGGAMVARPGVDGRGVVLVDDVVTTGATLTEAARACRAAGATSVRAASLAATVRLRPPPLDAGGRRRSW